MMRIKKLFFGLGYTLTIATFVSQPGVAITLSEFYSDQGIMFYDKNATSVTCIAASGDTTTPTTGDSKANEQTIYQYFIGKNLTPEQSAGIVGNLWVETGGTFDPKIHQNGDGPGRGIAQWTSTERWVDLVNFALAQNRSQWDLIVQLDFIWHEFEGSEKEAYDDLLTTQTVDDATESFLTEYERAGTPHLDKRIQHAWEAYDKYKHLAGISGSLSSGGCVGTVSGGTIVQIAEAEFAKGIIEDPAGCDSGNPSTPGTCGPEIDKYTDGTLEYWCADFVSWVYRTAGTPFTGGQSGGWRIAGVASVKSWFQENGIYFDRSSVEYTPQPGDVVFYSYSHTDIVVAVNETSIVTIGGNTSVANTQDGNGVGKHTKSRAQETIVGYGRLSE